MSYCEKCGAKIDISPLFGSWWKWALSLFRLHICPNPRWERYKTFRQRYSRLSTRAILGERGAADPWTLAVCGLLLGLVLSELLADWSLTERLLTAILLTALIALAWKRWTTRITVAHAPRARRRVFRVETPVEAHFILKVRIRNPDELGVINVTPVQEKSPWWPLWLPGGTERPSPTEVAITRAVAVLDSRGNQVSGETDPNGGIELEFGRVIGKRPFRIEGRIRAARPWMGWIAVRDDRADRVGRAYVAFVDPQDR